jgi:hypothetical protein
VVVINGYGGEVRVGYKVCVRLRAWQLNADMLTADDVEIDPYWVEQPGMKSLRLSMKNTTWTWRDVNPTVAGKSLFVRVSGSPEQR